MASESILFDGLALSGLMVRNHIGVQRRTLAGMLALCVTGWRR